jgi:hypothetical protein
MTPAARTRTAIELLDTIIAARKRYEALARMGLADEIVSMVSGSGEAKRDPGIVLYATQADLARGRLNDACRRAGGINADAPPPFVLRLRALCVAAAGEKDAADLALEVARAAGANDVWFDSVIATRSSTRESVRLSPPGSCRGN